MPKARVFNEQEKNDIVNKYLDGNSITAIAEKIYHCRAEYISRILKEKHIERHNEKVRISQIVIQEIIDLYVNHHYTQKQLSEKFSYSIYVIHRILVNNHVTLISQPYINKELNDHYFDIIDDEHKAYWLGFIFADGNVYGNALTIQIQERDKQLLEEFKKDLNINSAIHFRKREHTSVCSVQITSDIICESLKKYGIVPNKTKVTKHLPQVPEYLLPHFLRGLIDGDGWITIDQQGHYHIGFVSNYASTCEDFKKYCNIVTNNLCIENVSRKGTTPVFQIQSKKSTKCLANILYKDSTICLSRKYRKAEPLLDFKNDEDIV